MAFVQKELFALRDWRGEKAPSLWENIFEWNTAVPSLAGKILVVEFWATWCGKCNTKIPLLNDIQATFHDDVVVVGLTEELPEKVTPYIQKYNIQYSIATDRNNKYRDLIGITGTPNILIIDTDGVVQWQGSPNEDDKQDPFNKEVVQQIITQSKFSKLPPAKFTPITESLIIAPQPNIAQLKNLNIVGVKSVLNLRTNEEKGVIPKEEKFLNKDIEYYQVPILYLNDINESNVNEILTKISVLPKPCLVHCNVGLCAAAVALLAVAKEETKNGQAISRQQILDWGAGLGFNFADQPTFYEFLGRYLA